MEVDFKCQCGTEVRLAYTPPICPTCGADSDLRLEPPSPEAEGQILYLVRYWFHYNGLTEIPEWVLERLREACRATLVRLQEPPDPPI